MPLGSEWTIEAWFCYPLPETATGWNVLTTTSDGQCSQIVVRDGGYLGTRMGDLFQTAATA